MRDTRKQRQASSVEHAMADEVSGDAEKAFESGRASGPTAGTAGQAG